MSTGIFAGCGKRFADERKRLGFATPTAAAPSFGVTQAALSKVESGASVPGGELLAHAAELGMDVHYVLIGKRAGEIDAAILGMCEAALRDAYRAVRPGSAPLGAVRLSALVKAYNAALPHITPNGDVVPALRQSADLYVAFLDDPGNPGLIEHALFRNLQGEEAPANVSATHGSIAAGRDIKHAVVHEPKPPRYRKK